MQPARTAGPYLSERPSPVSPAPYGSSMCSNAGDADPPGTGALDRLGSAIEELARAARVEGAAPREIAERLARAWELVAELDPELARRLAHYDG